MSQVAISGNASGTGTLTIAAPNTNSNYTLTLPAATGTVASIASVNNNGVVYANSSGQPTTGTAFVFDGTNVGIGTSSPSARLHVQGGSAGSGSYNGYTKLAVEASDYSVISLKCPAANFNQIVFTDPTSSNLGGINYFNSSNATPNAMTFLTNGTERMRIDSSGYVLIGNTSNSSYGTASLCLPTNGEISVASGALRSRAIYGTTTSNGANQFIDANGYLYRSTSSLKYKTDVKNATHGLAEVMTLRPVTYKGKNDGETVFGGLIAEEVDAAGLTEFVQYADNGTPDALAYGNMVSLCIKAIQEQQALIQQLQADVAELKGATP